MDNILLNIEDLNVSYILRNNNKFRELKILRNINLQIFEGTKIGVIGESGSGKTTLGYGIIGLLSQEEVLVSGRINFYFNHNGEKKVDTLLDVKEKSFLDNNYFDKMRGFQGKNISMVFQDPFNALNPVIPIGKQIEEVITNHNKEKRSDEVKIQILELLSKVHLDDVNTIYRKYPHQLSGGQLQRVCIATAIANRPQLIIADEPTTSLDANLRTEILNLFNDTLRIFNNSVLLITHDFSVAKDFVDYIYVLYAGEIIEYGEIETVVNKPSHPYTKMLIDAIPDENKKGKTLKQIPGSLPDLTDENVFSHCIFLERCDKKFEKCFAFGQPKFYVKNGKKVKCYLYE